MDSSRPPWEKASFTHKPEFIQIEDAHAEHIHTEKGSYTRQEKAFPPLEDVAKTEFPFTLRLMSFGFSLMMLIAAIGAIIGTVISGILYLLSLGYSATLNKYTEKCFNWWKKFFVLSLGFFIAIFSPSLGLTIIVVYFILQGEKFRPGLFGRIFRHEE